MGFALADVGGVDAFACFAAGAPGVFGGKALGEGGRPGGDGEAHYVACFNAQGGAEFDRLAQVGAEDVDRALGAEGVAGRVGAGDAAEDREARLGGRTEEAVEEGALAVGRLRQGLDPSVNAIASLIVVTTVLAALLAGRFIATKDLFR